MARLTAAARKSIPKSQFGVPSKAPGSGSYPMPDRSHAVAAKAMASRFASPAVKAQVDAKANAVLGTARGAAMRAGQVPCRVCGSRHQGGHPGR